MIDTLEDMGPPPYRTGDSPKVKREPIVDTGLADWGRLLTDRLGQEAGVEIASTNGGLVRFKFRGQSFTVSVVRDA